jgi:lysozyme
MLTGIDVSHWEGEVDWPGVRSAGYRFAFTKATEGLNYLDDTFYANVAGAQAVGIPIGAFHFFRAAMPAQKQAEYFLRSISPLKLDLPPVLDVEENPVLSKPATAAAVKTWLDAVEQATGRKPIIYTGLYYWDGSVGNPGWAKDYPLWIAQYISGQQPRLPQSWSSWVFWQYTDKGSVPGCQGSVDLNYTSLSEAELMEMARMPFQAVVGGEKVLPLTDRILALEREIKELAEALKARSVL